MSVKRIYVEKKPEFAVKARELSGEIGGYLGIGTVTGVRVLIRYDIENLSEETYEAAKGTIFSEPPVDELYEEDFPRGSRTWCLPWSIFRDSLIRGQILRSSV